MKLSHSSQLSVLLLATACLVLPPPGEARGGRGRGGGSFGGLFGGWRSKYGSKSSSSSGGRRVISGSPMQTAANLPKVPPPPPPPPPPPKPIQKHIQMSSYPRQQLPPGYSYPAVPSQGQYYSNPQAVPAGAIYYARPPSTMGSDLNTFFTGMMLERMLFGNRHHVTHVYHQNPQGVAPPAEGNGRDIIVINNGQPQGESPQNPLAREEEEQEKEQEQQPESSEEPVTATAPSALPVGGIVCFPIKLNETDPQNPELQREVERIVCFPAPNPNDCEHNPQCQLEWGSTSSTTSTEPPIVAGDI
ncbi:hypothetical protein KR222_000325, partial [Zaprionus bogoriensis]